MSMAALREIGLAEVAEHSTKTDCWVVINDMVYDVTDFLEDHPVRISNQPCPLPTHVVPAPPTKRSVDAWPAPGRARRALPPYACRDRRVCVWWPRCAEDGSCVASVLVAVACD